MIINSDKTLSDVYKENIDIVSGGNLKLTGMVNGNILSEGSSTLIVTGMVNGDIHVYTGSDAIITGMVNGTVFGDGGNIRITGMVKHVEGDGSNLIIEKVSVINGVFQP